MKPATLKPLIAQAHGYIAPYIRETPTVTLASGGFGVSNPLTLKLELLQHSGSFKARGPLAVFYKAQRREGYPAQGVIAASGGNHGAAVAYAARQLGYPAEIFVPTISSPAKVARLHDYGATVTVTGADYIEALAASKQRAAQTGSLVVHAFNQVEVLAGQGTVALELERQLPELDTVLVAVGGGGLIGGIAAWYQGRCRVVGVEPERAPTLHDSLAAGERLDVKVGGIAADALGSRYVGEMMFPIAQQYIDRVVLVSEAAIAQAQKQLWQDLRIVAEPAGVVAIAALMSGRYQPEPGEQVGLIICGGNADLSAFLSALM